VLPGVQEAGPFEPQKTHIDGETMNLLDAVADLSHEFGIDDYVLGGGGNTSAKDEETLWVKPSGTTLREIAPEQFLALDRRKITQLYELEAPAEPSAREAFVKDHMLATVLPGESGRPSVEAPLHNVFDATFVVHTHMTLLNGLTCGRDGAAACRELFPEALWMDYVDPGYTLCMRAREEVDAFAAEHGRQPSLVIMKNHGVFVAEDTPEAVRRIHGRLAEVLGAHYEKAGVPVDRIYDPMLDEERMASLSVRLKEVFGDEARCTAFSGAFIPPPGPLSPDHLVYAKAYAYDGELTPEGAAAFRERWGYTPRVVATPDAVVGIGPSQKVADMALALARDGALVCRLTEAFGGVEFMSDRAREFIENWEVEAYRSKVSLGDGP